MPKDPTANVKAAFTESFHKLVTIEEMAKLIDIHPRTLRTWARKGLVPMIKVGGFCRFNPEQVWTAMQETATTKVTGQPFEGAA